MVAYLWPAVVSSIGVSFVRMINTSDPLTHIHEGPMKLSRRRLVSGAASIAALSVLGRQARAQLSHLGCDTGVQLYMARELLQKDFEGALAEIARIGVKQVEFAGFYEKSAASIRTALAANGLQAVGAHCMRVDMSDAEVERTISFCAEVGMPYLVAPSPLLRVGRPPATSMQQYIAVLPSFSLDDARYSADRFNRIGERVKAAGMAFAYHNHGFELQPRGDTNGFDVMLQRTEPGLVLLEVDIGNLVAGGGDPYYYLRQYSGRFRLAHLKDWAGPFTPDPLKLPATARFGEGVIDWKRMLKAASSAGVRHFLVEQEEVPANQVIDEIRGSRAYFGRLY